MPALQVHFSFILILDHLTTCGAIPEIRESLGYLPRGVGKITSFISALFCLLINYYSWEFWWEAFSKGWVSETLWGSPLAISDFFLPHEAIGD